MRLPSLIQLGLAIGGLASSIESNLTYFGAPRATLDGVLPVLDIAESYIRSQNHDGSSAIGFTGDGSCSANNPCILGSCCNRNGKFSQCRVLLQAILTGFEGQCGYGPEHCSPDKCVANCDAKAPCGEFSVDGVTSCPLNACCSRLGFCGMSDVFCRDSTSAAQTAGANGVPSCGKGSGSASRHVAYYQSW